MTPAVCETGSADSTLVRLHPVRLGYVVVAVYAFWLSLAYFGSAAATALGVGRPGSLTNHLVDAATLLAAGVLLLIVPRFVKEPIPAASPGDRMRYGNGFNPPSVPAIRPFRFGCALVGAVAIHRSLSNLLLTASIPSGMGYDSMSADIVHGCIGLGAGVCFCLVSWLRPYKGRTTDWMLVLGLVGGWALMHAVVGAVGFLRHGESAWRSMLFHPLLHNLVVGVACVGIQLRMCGFRRSRTPRFAKASPPTTGETGDGG